MSGLPEPGPARDRRVAEVVGWDATEPGWCWDADMSVRRHPSTSDADALAALESWRLADPDRGYAITRHAYCPVAVSLRVKGMAIACTGAATLPAAATAALLASRSAP